MSAISHHNASFFFAQSYITLLTKEIITKFKVDIGGHPLPTYDAFTANRLRDSCDLDLLNF